MKRNMKLAFALALMGVIFGCAASAQAQPPRTGGYREVAKTDAGALAAADFAITAQSAKTGNTFELLDLVKAERQVVAGSNYKLCIQVSADGDEAFYVLAVVYVDLKKNSKLTSWADSDCGDQ
jgi:hypothetical protein